MTKLTQRTPRSAAVLSLASCGGSSPLDNPSAIQNPAVTGNQRLAFAYFQRCVFPVLLAQLPITMPDGSTTINTCAASGCHDNTNGTGGAFRVIGNAQPIDLANPANTPDIIRNSDMYKNFYSAQGEVVFGSPLASRLLAKPMVNGVLHGGGLVFANANDPNARLIQYWINNPAPTGQSEFSTSTYNMFTPADAATGACNTQ